ncbi:ABC transporter substrate-binding protein [Halalkalibacter kiskunsagensis]|uniref:ABC transporter substrate-binding protein n=1 Tax=Halalkalibacter kiskunsagensis TaxID=1548599 RepID=A0ABV6KEM2_9BACI
MKKSLLAIISLFFLFMTLIGCSENETSSDSVSDGQGSSTNDEVTKVVFWDLFSGNDGEVMTEIVKEFNEEHPGIEVEKITQEWGEYYTKLTTSVLGNQAPDLGVSHATRITQLNKQGVIQSMNDEVEKSGINFNELSENAVNATIVDGEHYAVPLDYHALLLFYNKKVLDEMGLLNENGEPEFNNYDEFVNLLLEVKEKDPNITPLAMTGQGTHPFRLWYSFYKQLGGGDIYSAEEAKSTIDVEIGKESLQAVYDLYHTHKVVPPRIESSDEMFQPGNAAFMINGTWAVNNTYKALGDDLGVMKFPTFFDKASVYADSHSFILPTNQKRDEKTTEAAMTFIKWVTDNGWKWSKAGHLPVSKTVLDSKELQEQPFRSEYESMSEYMEYLPANEKVWFASSSELLDVLDAVWIDQYSVDQGVESMQDVITKQLQD